MADLIIQGYNLFLICFFNQIIVVFNPHEKMFITITHSRFQIITHYLDCWNAAKQRIWPYLSTHIETAIISYYLLSFIRCTYLQLATLTNGKLLLFYLSIATVAIAIFLQNHLRCLLLFLFGCVVLDALELYSILLLIVMLSPGCSYSEDFSVFR